MKISKGYKAFHSPNNIYHGEKWKLTIRLYGENSTYKRGKVLETETVIGELDPDSGYIEEWFDNYDYTTEDWGGRETEALFEHFRHRIRTTYELISEPHPEREEEN